jgi:asparagine synthase (glutamine-hydrolysing)
MGGIFGLIANRPLGEMISAATSASRALAHRGPDGQGIEVVGEEPTAILAHRRLAILDLSSAGEQPMRDERTGAWLSYNGKVYNFRRIRERLRSLGIAVHSESDAEAALKSLMIQGDRAIDDWRGMFAFGLWRPDERRLTLARDRLGVKPLYYFHQGETFLFASEIRALLATGLIPRVISRAALESFLAYGSIEQPLTILENVYSVLPGHLLTFQDGWVRQEPYWRLPVHDDSPPAADRSEAETAAEIAELVAESVGLRMEADTPVSVFLSGGIDSSVVTALARRSGELRSFTLSFEDQRFDELRYAQQISRRYGVDHIAVAITQQEALDKTSRAMWAMDQPSLDGINIWLISKAASQAGMKVALTGIGGDELFAGYRYFQTLRRDELLRAGVNATPPQFRIAAASAIDGIGWIGRIGRIGTSHRAAKLTAILRGESAGASMVELRRTLFTERQRRALTTGERPDSSRLRAWNERRNGDASSADAVNQASMLELSGYLANTLLRDADVMSMCHGVELRTPLLDHKLVERMLSIPGAMKLREGRPKWLLAEALPDLPREIIHCPKQGFELPYDQWLRGSLRDQVEDAIAGSKLNWFLDASAMRTIWTSFLDGHMHWSRVWALHVLGQWMEIHL